jgi:uncharacterized protein (DUF305 family)
MTLALGACGGSTKTTTSAADKAAGFNAADVSFTQGMIPHHEQAIEMADLALDPTAQASDAVKALATTIKAAQDPEVALMKGWLKAWGKEEMTSDHSGHDMKGMASTGDMKKLAGLKAAEFDKTWIKLMIAHHEGAVSSATDVAKNGASAEVRTLAAAIVKGQEAEIVEMTALAKG